MVRETGSTPPAKRALGRKRFLAASAGAFASIAIVRSPARAADFEFKLAHDLPPAYPLHVRSLEMAEAILRETNGRLKISVFPNSVLGGQTGMLSQLRSGAIQMLTTLNGVYSEVVPLAGIEAVGFAFTNAQQAINTMEGPLGAMVRDEFKAKGIYAFEKRWSLGMRHMCSSTKPITTVADFAGFKMRTPPAKIAVDLFTTLGAAPTPITAAEMYTSMKTHLIDGLDLPVDGVQLFKIYEVIKHITLTNHMWSGYFMTANLEAFEKLPADIQAVLNKNANKYALLEQHDRALGEKTFSDQLRREGITISGAKTSGMRARLSPYYARWKANFGEKAWSLLEAGGAGKLA